MESSLSESQASTFQQLQAMRFDRAASFTAAQTFGANVEGAIQFLFNQPPSAPKDKDVDTEEKAPVFPISIYTEKLVAGFIRSQQLSALKIPQDIHDVIGKYTNMLFVKLRYDIDDESSRFDELLAIQEKHSLRSLAVLIEDLNKVEFHFQTRLTSDPYYLPVTEKIDCPTFVRIRLRMHLVKRMFAIEKRIKVSLEEIDEYIQRENAAQRWVEIPDDHLKTNLAAVIDIANMVPDSEHESEMEIAVDRYNVKTKKWAFDCADDADDIEWMSRIKMGDIIDVQDVQEKWYESMVRFVRGKEVYIHAIGWNIKWDEIVPVDDVTRVSRRGKHSRGPHRPPRRPRV